MKSTRAVCNFLFGKEPDKNSPTYSYQHRQSKLVFSNSLPAIFWIGLVWYGASQNMVVGLVVAFSILYLKIHYVASVASDAVFDSLWERINLQSRWLNSRLTHIEDQLNPEGRLKQSGQQHWSDNESYDGQLTDAWRYYPENEQPRDRTGDKWGAWWRSSG